jgi:hypothetical protein
MSATFNLTIMCIISANVWDIIFVLSIIAISLIIPVAIKRLKDGYSERKRSDASR